MSRPSIIASLLVMFALIVPGAGAAPRPDPQGYLTPPGPTQQSDRPLTASETQRYIVQLADPALAQAPASHPGFGGLTLQRTATGRLLTETSAAVQYRTFLQQQQINVFGLIQQAFPTAELQRQYNVVFNGMSVKLANADEAALARLKATPGVLAVYPEQEYIPTMFSSIPQIGADTLWSSAAIGGQQNAGAGVKIAVIDAGIRSDNPFFNPAGFSYPEGYPKGDTRFTTPKVIVARAYFRPDAPPAEGSDTPQPGPQDSSHGTHVAGIAGGVANTSATVAGLTQTISGVAPRAYLMNYKIFYASDSRFSGSAFDTEIIAAINDAVADGADVVNNSYGGRAGTDESFDAVTVAAEAAVDAGVTMVYSQGNEGPDPSTAGAPGFGDKLITVGATTTAQTIATGFVDVVAPEGAPEVLRGRQYATAAFGPLIIDQVFGPAPYTPTEATGDASLACEPLPAGSLSGQIALIERGVCEFSIKVFNAQQAGAIGAIVYNSEAGGEALLGMAAGTNADQITIPAIFVQRSLGVGMVDWYAQYGAAARVQIDPRGRVIEQTPDVIAAFSSRGPTFNAGLKPDVVAPGVNILSSGYGAAEGEDVHRGFGLVSGTSMASPHVAGAAALLKQIHPNWTPSDIKSALMSTANTNVFVDEDGTSASVLDQGAGRIDLSRASNPGLIFDRPSLSFGRVTPSTTAPTRTQLTITARNVSGSAQNYTISTRYDGGVSATVTANPATVQLAPGASAQIVVTLEVATGAPAGDYSGLLEMAGSQPLHIPFYAQVLPAERGTKVLLLDNDGSTSLELPDYAGFYGNALTALGIPFTYLDVDALAGEAQTLPPLTELQQHEIVLWFTGDNFIPSGTFPVPTPLTPSDQNLLIAYLQSGGNLIATGQDLASASDINTDQEPLYGRSDLYHGYLGARFVQDDVYTRTSVLDRKATGLAGQVWLEDIVLDLSPPLGEEAVISSETGAGNQVFVDEVTIVDIDRRTPDPFTKPIFKAASTSNQEAGTIGLNRTDNPTLERPTPVFSYRSTYLAFGLEGVRNDTGTTSREELLQQILYWTVDRPSVALANNGVVNVSDPAVVQNFTAEAITNTPAQFIKYRWDFGDGSPYVITEGPTVVYKYAAAGTYQVRVEAIDSYGHSAVSAGQGSPPEDGSDPPAEPTQAGGQQVITQPAGPAPNAQAFVQTRQVLQGRFHQFWQQNGGLAVFGLPLSAQAGEPSAQAFERARFEYHPENAAPYDVLLSHLGSQALAAQGRDWRAFPTVASAPADCLYFADTQHSLCGAFKAYWQTHGLEFDGQAGTTYAESLALFGLPLSEPQEELIEGKPVLVQWFERARFEYHPHNPEPYQVLLGRLGAEHAGVTQ